MMMGMWYTFICICQYETYQTDPEGSESVMMKKILCLLAGLVLFAVLPAAAEEAAQPVTSEELTALLESVRTQALAGEPLNDPAEDSAVSEDGTLFRYEVARIYADGTLLAEDTPVNALVFEDSEGPVFRGTGIDTLLADLLAAFPNGNPDLAGTREEAVLYLDKTESGGFVYGRVLRDGQRVSAVEYAEVLPEGETFRCAAVTFSLLEGRVVSIRVDGLNPAGAGQADASHANEVYAELKDLAAADEYRAVKTSRDGQELAPFGAEDLVFSGISYPELQPDMLPGEPETELVDNEDGTWLLRCEGNGYEAVFTCGADGENASILSFMIRDENMEGPRAVRLGDLFYEDYQRFRSEENGTEEDLTEILYGTEGVAPWGYAAYDPSAGETSLRYVTRLEDGKEVELLLRYVDNYLTEIIIQTV